MPLPGFFKNQSQQKPEGKKIQTDQPVDLKTALAVIPGTGMKKTEKTAGQIFCRKNKNCINGSPEKKAKLFQITGNHGNQSTQTINGEHQKGSLPHQPFIIGYCEGVDTGKKNFHAPSDHSAADEIFPDIF